MPIDPRWLIGAALLALFLLILLGLRAGWRAKQRAQAALPAAPPASAVSGELVDALDGVHYVATTLDSRPLERLVAGPLAFRGRCRIEVRRDGVRLAIAGAEPVGIPADAIDAVGAVTATIDRAVERDGLTSISWRLGAGTVAEATVHTRLRVVERDERERLQRALAALHPELTPAPPGAGTPNEESR